MHEHNEDSRLNHEFQLLSAFKNLTKKSQEGEKKLKENHLEIEQLKELNRQKDEKMDELKNDVNTLKNKLENVRVELSSKIESNQQLTVNRLTEIEDHRQKQQSTTNDQFKEDIQHLQTFADRVSKLHSTLSERYLQLNHHHCSTLFQEDYDNDKDVASWNKTIDEANKDDNTSCEYLTTLTKSMNEYKKTTYPSTYKSRLENLVLSLPSGSVFQCFLRIRCYFGSVCVKSFETFEEFQKEIDKKSDQKNTKRFCKVQNEPLVSTYCVKDCLHVVLVGFSECSKYLLHNTNENKKLCLPPDNDNKEGYEVKDISQYRCLSSIVLFFESSHIKDL